jgi:hypothetical protein
MVGSQIGDLISGPSFGHNLCFRCPNGSCEPILDIYVPRAFQWYKKLFNPLGFDLIIIFQKFRNPLGVHWDSNCQNGSSFESVRVHSLTFFCTPKSMRYDSHASLLAHNLASHFLSHKPKVKVAINSYIGKGRFGVKYIHHFLYYIVGRNKISNLNIQFFTLDIFFN